MALKDWKFIGKDQWEHKRDGRLVEINGYSSKAPFKVADSYEFKVWNNEDVIFLIKNLDKKLALKYARNYMRTH